MVSTKYSTVIWHNEPYELCWNKRTKCISLLVIYYESQTFKTKMGVNGWSWDDIFIYTKSEDFGSK